MSRLHFYATPEDGRAICAAVALRNAIAYVPERRVDGRVADLQPERFASCAQIPDFGHAPSGSRLDSQNFAVIFEGDAIESNVESIGTLGKLQTYIGPSAKETAIAFRPAGLFGQNGLMLGEIIDAFCTVEAKKLFRAFQTAIRKRAVGKARGAWICRDAYAFLQNGGQLSDHFDDQNGAMFPIDIGEVQLIV